MTKINHNILKINHNILPTERLRTMCVGEERSLTDEDGDFLIENLKPGMILRHQGGDAFSDCTILRVIFPAGDVEVARPYCYASSTESIPTPLVGFERFTISCSKLASFTLVEGKYIL